MAQSILTSVKKVIGIPESDTSFDTDLVMHINAELSVLGQIGIGPDGGFMIEGADETWDTFLGPGPTLNMAKSYMYARVKLLFDPPGTSFAIESYKSQAAEYLWRLNVIREGVAWQDPTPPVETTSSSW